MIQNISQKRGNKAITQEDLKLIYRANNFNMYPTTLEARIPSSATLGSPYFLIYYMKGEAGGKVSILWQRALYHPHLDRTSPYIGSNIWWCGRSIEPCQIGTYDASQIDQSLKINEGEVKIMVDIILRVQPDCVKEILGLYLVSPKINAGQFSFNHIAFFTPKPGLFDENGPQ